MVSIRASRSSLHGNLQGLADDDHLQYLLINGTRAMTGDLNMGDNDINQVVDITNDVEMTIRRTAGTGTIIDIQDSGSVDVADFQTGDIFFGRTDGGNGRILQVDDIEVTTSRGFLRLYPDGNAGTPYTVAPALPGVLQWSSIMEASLGVGVNTFGGFISLNGTFRQSQNGFAFNNGLIFNHATTYENNAGAAANFGPIFTLVDQPLIRSTGGALTMSIANSVRAQPRFGPHTGGGSLTVTNVTLYETAGNVQPSTTITTWRCFRAGNRGVMTGTITTMIGLDIVTFDQGGTNLGIQCTMVDSGTDRFIQHTGTALSTFAGDLHMNDGISMVFGSVGSSRVEFLRIGGGTVRMIAVGGSNNEGLDWNFDSAPNNINVTSSTTAGVNFNTPTMAFGPSVLADGTGNFVFAFSPGLRGTQAAGSYAEVLFTSSSSIAVADVITTFATWEVNAVTFSFIGGSIVDATVAVIQGNVAGGTNRYGLLITSAPTGGTLNYALRCTAGDARFDARVDINNPIALGGGAAATLGTIGGTGPTAAAQAQWVEIDIGGTPHWIAVWT